MQPTEFQKKVWFNALTALCILVIGTLLVGGIWLTGEVLAYLQPVLVPLAVAGIFAYLLDPIVNWMERKGLTRLKAIIVVFILGAIAIGGFSILLKGPITDQVETLKKSRGQIAKSTKKMFSEIGKVDGLVEALPAPIQKVFPKSESEEIPNEGKAEETTAPANSVDLKPEETGASDEVVSPSLVGEAEDYLNAPRAVIVGPEEAVSATTEEEKVSWLDLLSTERIMASLQDSFPNLAQRVAEVITRGASKFFGVIGYALGFILVPIYLFFFLKESVVIKDNWRRFVPLRASKFKDEVVTVVEKINGYLIAFFRGQVLVSLIDGFLVGFVLFLFGHPYPVLVGIALAVLGVLPFIGNIICMIPAVITAYAAFSDPTEDFWIRSLIGDNAWIYVVIILGIFIIVQQINSLVTAPKIVGDSVGLHPMTVIFSMLFWSLLLGGFLGALLAVPLTASVKVLFQRYVWERKVMNEDLELLAEN